MLERVKYTENNVQKLLWL